MISTVQDLAAEALFVSYLQPSECPSRQTVEEAVTAMILRHGSDGCAAGVAAEFGDHPEVGRAPDVLGALGAAPAVARTSPAGAAGRSADAPVPESFSQKTPQKQPSSAATAPFGRKCSPRQPVHRPVRMSEEDHVTATTELPAAIGTTHDAPSARDLEDLVREHMPMVGHLVRELLNRVPGHVHADDLSSAGFAALLGAARSFDVTRGIPFHRFAAVRIRGALLDELRGQDWASRSVRARARRTAPPARS